MDKLSVFKCKSYKPCLCLKLDIADKSKLWILPDKKRVNRSSKRIAFEIGDENSLDKQMLKIIEMGDLDVRYLKNKKIKFKVSGEGSFSGEYVFYIPSWGLNTGNKIWVLIPSSKM